MRVSSVKILTRISELCTYLFPLQRRYKQKQNLELYRLESDLSCESDQQFLATGEKKGGI